MKLSKSINLSLIAIFISLVFFSACKSRKEKFDEIWPPMIDDLTNNAEQYRPYYKEMIDHLDEDSIHYIDTILEHCGDPCPAVELSRHLNSTNGIRKVLLSCLIASYSHGYHTESVKILQKYLQSNKCSFSNYIRLKLADADYLRKACAGMSGAITCNVPFHQWHEMNLDQQWKMIYTKITDGSYTELNPLDDYNCKQIVDKLTYANYWDTIKKIDPDWDDSFKFEPFLEHTEGEKQVLVGVIVALGSYGNNTNAMHVLQAYSKSHSNKVSVLASKSLKALTKIRNDYISIARRNLDECYGVLLKERDWKTMSLEERCSLVKTQRKELLMEN